MQASLTDTNIGERNTRSHCQLFVAIVVAIGFRCNRSAIIVIIIESSFPSSYGLLPSFSSLCTPSLLFCKRWSKTCEMCVCTIVIHSLSRGQSVSFQVQLQVVIQVLQPSRCSYRLSSSFLFAILFSCSRPGKSESAGRGRGSRRNKPQHFGDFISPGGGGAGGRNRELDSRKDMRPNYNSNNIASNNNNNRIVNAVHRATYNQVR